MSLASLTALINSLLPSGSEIPAVDHRTVEIALATELFAAQSRGNVLAGVQAALAIAAGDKVLVIRSGQAYLLDADEFGFIDTFVGLSDVNIPSPANDQVVVWDSTSSKFIVKDISDISTGGDVTGSGTINKLAKFTSGTAIGDSLIMDDGTTVTIEAGVSINAGVSVNGSLDLAVNTWHTSSEGQNRILYVSASHAYFNSPASIYFRSNNSAADTVYIASDTYYGNGSGITNVNAATFEGDGRKISNAVIALGSNPTAYDLLSKTKARFTVTYTSTNTLTFSNASALEEFTMQLTNTNANTITFAGITLYFKTADLPSGVTFAANALTFPADSAVKYNIVGVAFDGSTFDCKIEIR